MCTSFAHVTFRYVFELLERTLILAFGHQDHCTDGISASVHGVLGRAGLSPIFGQAILGSSDVCLGKYPTSPTSPEQKLAGVLFDPGPLHFGGIYIHQRSGPGFSGGTWGGPI
jgi:hypothetical protein